MYIWVAIDVEKQVRALCEKAKECARVQGLSSPTFTLPFHISLKISFAAPEGRFDDIVRDLREFFNSLKPFSVEVKALEKAGPIVWLTMKDSAELTRIHNALDEMLFEKYGIVQHEFDRAFLFHTSVLISDDTAALQKAFDTLRNADIPAVLRAERFIIGSSAEGKAGTYRVNEEIEV